MTAPTVPAGWATVRLEDIAEVRLGRQRSPKNHTGTQMRRYLRAANVTWDGIDTADVKEMNFTDAEVETYRLRDGDLLLSEASGSATEVGKSGVWRGQLDGDICFQNTLIRVRPEDGIDSDFLYYRFLHEALRGGFVQSSRGVGIHHLGSAKLSALTLNLPPTGEQQRIALRISNQLDDLAHARRALVELRKSIRQLQRTLLGNALAGRLTSRSGGSADSLLGLAERRRIDALSKLRGRAVKNTKPPADPAVPPPADLPTGWQWVTWAQVGVAQNGAAFPSSDYGTEGVRLLRPGNLGARGTLIWTPENTRWMPNRYGTSHERFKVSGGELVMNLTAQSLKDDFLGRVCLTGTGDACLLNQRIARLVPLGLTPRFAQYVFRGPEFRAFVKSLNTGSLIQHMFTSQLDEYCFALPPISEQEAIADLLDEALSNLENLEDGLAVVLAQLDVARRSVVTAGVTGRLPETSNPADEPIDVLLKSIEEERAARASAEGGGKRAIPQARTPRAPKTEETSA